MNTKQYELKYPHSDFLNAEEQAVIDAKFAEITVEKQSSSLAQYIKDLFQFIKKPL